MVRESIYRWCSFLWDLALIAGFCYMAERVLENL